MRVPLFRLVFVYTNTFIELKLRPLQTPVACLSSCESENCLLKPTIFILKTTFITLTLFSVHSDITGPFPKQYNVP